jgi:hypothetical protein
MVNDHMTLPIIKGLPRDADTYLAYREFPRIMEPKKRCDRLG